MSVIFVTGSDTAVGKTHVAGLLARRLAKSGRVQVIKPVESGAGVGRPADAPRAAGSWAEPHTLISLPEPLAPLAAAERSGKKLSLPRLVNAYRKLPPSTHRVIEGAGGVAVPIDPTGLDWADFVKAVQPDLVVVVVEDRLGAINQARLAVAYLKSKKIKTNVAVWLNAAHVRPSREVLKANRDGIIQSKIKLAGESGYKKQKPIFSAPLFQ
jgi:dethiobiotin synthetase